MELKTFLDNGAVISLSGEETLFLEGLSLCTSDQSQYLIAPEFSLDQLHKTYAFGHSSRNPEFLKIDSDLTMLQLEWSADREAYLDSYQKVQAYIQSGELQKAVPFMKFRAVKPDGFNQKILPQIISRLLSIKHDKEYLYGMWGKDEGFVGATPEILIQKKTEKTKYSTMALAGTLSSSDTTEMVKDVKLADEHRIVMDDVSRKLFDHEVEWTTPSERQFGMLKHLLAESDFHSELNVFELIKRLSPTSALGVFPSEQWLRYNDILHLDTRGSYGAPFAYVGPTEVMVLVCLRGVFWDKNYLYIPVGGGVTAQSIYDIEVKELELKFLSTKSKLGL